MPQSSIPHQAFTLKYDRIVRELRSEIYIGLPSVLPQGGLKSFKKFIAIWDTGATGTVITQKVVDELSLKSTGKIRVHGVNSETIADTYFIDLGLPNKVMITNVSASCNQINGCDILIGMDIISMGDFALSNGNNITIFSFCMPPHKNPIDLVEKSNKVNQRIRKH